MFSQGRITSAIFLLTVILLSIGFSMCLSHRLSPMAGGHGPTFDWSGSKSSLDWSGSKSSLKEGLFPANNPTLQQIVSILKNYNTQDVAKCNETISKIKPMLESSSTQITDTNLIASLKKILADSSLSSLQQMDKIIALNIPTTEAQLYPLISDNLGVRYGSLITMLQNMKQLEDTPAINSTSFSNDSVLTNILNKAIGSPVVYGGNTSYTQLYNYMQEAYPTLNLTPIPTTSV